MLKSDGGRVIDASPGTDVRAEFRAVHARLGRAVVAIYIAVAVMAVAALVTALVSDLDYQEAQAREAVLKETELRADYLSRHLTLLADEVHRLGARPEIDLRDRSLAPERALLDSSHDNSTIFNRGVALLGEDGSVLWSDPPVLLEGNPHPLSDAVLASVRRADGVQIVPSATDEPKAAVLFVACPIMRQSQFTGVLLGAIDLVAARVVDTGFGRRVGVEVALTTREGRVLFPPAERLDPRFRDVSTATVEDRAAFLPPTSRAGVMVAGARVPDTGFVLLSIVDERALVRPARSRLATRLTIGCALAAVPLLALSLVLRGSLRRFRVAEEEAIRNDRMRSLVAAAALIAHEVKNSLNSLRLGLDLVLSGDAAGREPRRREVLDGLRREIHRLSEFSTQLLTFSRGIVPRVAPLELSGFTEKVVAAMQPVAEEQRVMLRMTPSTRPVPVRADPTLIHVVLTNLVLNAIHFASTTDAPEVRVTVAPLGDRRAVVRVTDNGPGVAEHIRARLFEPFVTGRSNGVGIGLALSRSIARAHRGDVVCVSGAPGAVFELILPEAV
jgi:signal transduction histidine kinase